MDFPRKILILIVILVFSYIIFRLIQKRGLLLSETSKQLVGQGDTQVPGVAESMHSMQESFLGLPSVTVFPTADSELKAMSITDPGPGIVNFDKTKSNLPLKEYIIKASYNTPFSGSYVSLDTIKYILSRGCRFIDLEVYLINDAVYVAQSLEPDNITIDSKNQLLLDDVLGCIVINAFTSPAPNPLDPLFVQLRMKTDDPNIYKYSAMSVDKNFANKLYKDSTGSHTVNPLKVKLGDLMGKIVLVIDETVAPKYNTFPECGKSKDSSTCYNLDNYVGMVAGSQYIRTSTYTDLTDQSTKPLVINDNGKTSLVEIERIVTPNLVSNVVNPNPNTFIKKYGAQITCYPFYLKDSNLTNYEMLFSENKSAFVTFAQYSLMK